MSNVTGGIKELTKKRNYLEALYSTVKEQVKNGKTIEQISELIQFQDLII